MVSHKLLNMVPYTVGPCCLSTLYIEEWICCLSTLDKVEWICCSQIPNLFSPPFAFGNHKVTSLHTLPSSKRSAKGWAGGKKSPGEARERSRGGGDVEFRNVISKTRNPPQLAGRISGGGKDL